MLTGPVPVRSWIALNCHRVILAASELTVLQQADNNPMEVDAALAESAELDLTGPRAIDMNLAILKIAVVELDVTRGCLGTNQVKTYQ